MDETKFLIFWQFGRNFLLGASGFDSRDNKLSLMYSNGLLCSYFAFLVPCRIWYLVEFNASEILQLSHHGSFTCVVIPMATWNECDSKKIFILPWKCVLWFINLGSNIQEVSFLFVVWCPKADLITTYFLFWHECHQKPRDEAMYFISKSCGYILKDCFISEPI